MSRNSGGSWAGYGNRTSLPPYSRDNKGGHSSPWKDSYSRPSSQGWNHSSRYEKCQAPVGRWEGNRGRGYDLAPGGQRDGDRNGRYDQRRSPGGKHGGYGRGGQYNYRPSGGYNSYNGGGHNNGRVDHWDHHEEDLHQEDAQRNDHNAVKSATPTKVEPELAPKSRHEELTELVEGKNPSERRVLFDSLSHEDKLVVQGFPPLPGFSNPLPTDLPPEALLRDPEGKLEEKRAAARHAVEEANKKFPDDDDSDYDDPYDDEGDEDSYGDESCDGGSPFCKCRACRSRKRQKTTTQYERFVLALPYCLLFDAAFRVRWPRRGDADLCWCPCGAYMKPWQDFFKLTGMADIEKASELCGKEGKKKKPPFALLAHLRKHGESDPLHFAVAVYLETLYKNWSGPGLAHKDIYKNVDDKLFRMAESAENRQSRRAFNDMQTALLASEERERAMRQVNEKFKKRMDRLDKINHEYKLKVEETNEMLRKLGLEIEEREVEIGDQDLESYRLIFESFLQAVKAKAARDQTRTSPIKFVVTNNFILQELLDDLDACENRDNSFLLRDLSYQSSDHYHAPKLVFDWKITFGDAIDEGGPTKHFLCQVWKQLPALKVSAYGLEVKLFEYDDKSPKVVGFVPVRNDQLEFRYQNKDHYAVDAIVEKAKRYYRAIGRIMFHSLMRGFVISHIAMPAFYRNVVLRECDLSDGRYRHHKVIRDIQALGGNFARQYRDIDKMIGSPLSLYGIESEGVMTKESFVSKFLHHIFIDERSIALQALREGITLNGYAMLPTLLRTMPDCAISKLLFAPERISVESVLEALTPEYSDPERAGGFVEGQIYFFEDVLRQVIRNRSEADETFLPNFVSFVTGFTFVPHRLADPHFQIVINFQTMTSQEKPRPEAKTCVNTLYLPSHAYNGDAELFLEVLDDCFLQMWENNFSDA